jgi:hypothetical protein
MFLSEPLDFLERYPVHLKQQPAMSETTDICCAVSSRPICHGHFNDLKVLLYRSENKVEIAKGVKIAKIGTVGRN